MKQIIVLTALIFSIGSVHAQDVYQLIPYRIGDKWGYSDTLRKIIIPVQFEDAEMFSHGFAQIIKNGKKGLIDSEGQYFIQPDYNEIEYDYFKRAFKVKQYANSSWLYRNEDGTFTPASASGDDWGNEIVFEEPVLERGRPMEDIFYMNGKAGFFQRKYLAGKIITTDTIPPIKYDSLKFNFINSNKVFLKAKKNKKWGVITSWDKEVIPCNYEAVGGFVDQSFIVVKQKGKWGIVNEANKIVFPITSEKINLDDNRLGFRFFKNGLCGHFNPQTKKTIEPKYKKIEGFVYGNYSYVETQDGRKGLINKNGVEFFVD